VNQPHFALSYANLQPPTPVLKAQIPGQARDDYVRGFRKSQIASC